MVTLSPADLQGLARVLSAPPIGFDRVDSRPQVLELAGLGALVPQVDLSGAPLIAATRVAVFLGRYGRLSDGGHEALGLLVNLLKELTGAEQREFLDSLLVRYQMMTPVAPAPRPSEWRGDETPDAVGERIIGENTLRPIAYLARALQVARAVAYLAVRDGASGWSGTGFLVTRDLLLTNHHVLPDPGLAATTLIRFNYEDDFDGRAQAPREYRCRPGGQYRADATLDYALVELEGAPGDEWGWLPLRDRPIRLRDRVSIVQHPGGQAKQIALQHNFVEYVGGDVVQYVTSPLPGSSGSPVFNERWEAVALHHAGGNVSEPTTGRRYFRNEGIQAGSILRHLPADLRAAAGG
jgi:V8-like Glu-specific endopeptidase